VRVREGDSIDQIKVVGADGTSSPLTLSKTKKTILNFWATTCVTCIREMPVFEELASNGRYDVVALSLDTADREPVIDRIWKSKGFSFGVHRADESSIEKLFDVTTLSIPVTIVLDATGKIESIWQGAVDESQFK
jgi:thiol-disulfide isomerase/thioredoxin